MTNGPVTTVLLRARTALEAQVVLALLRAEGITAFVNGSALADEFAVSQRAMGLAGVVIEVRQEDLLRAQQLVEEARKAGRESGDEIVEAAPEEAERSQPAELEPVASFEAGLAAAAPPLTRRSRVALALGLLGWALAGGLLYAFVNASRELARVSAARQAWPWTTVPLPDGWRTTWKDTHRPSTDYLDKDHDGLAEVSTHYVRTGWKRSVSFDTNENGLPEREEFYAADGRLIYTIADADENGVFELDTNPRRNGASSVSRDSDQDGRMDRHELRTAASVLLVDEQDADGDGCWETQAIHYPDGTIYVWHDLDQDGILDRVDVHDASGKLVRTQVNRGAQGFVDEK